MVQVYLNLIRRGRKTLDDVPAHLRAEVQALLEAENEQAP